MTITSYISLATEESTPLLLSLFAPLVSDPTTASAAIEALKTCNRIKELRLLAESHLATLDPFLLEYLVLPYGSLCDVDVERYASKRFSTSKDEVKRSRAFVVNPRSKCFPKHGPRHFPWFEGEFILRDAMDSESRLTVKAVRRCLERRVESVPAGVFAGGMISVLDGEERGGGEDVQVTMEGELGPGSKGAAPVVLTISKLGNVQGWYESKKREDEAFTRSSLFGTCIKPPKSLTGFTVQDGAFEQESDVKNDLCLMQGSCLDTGNEYAFEQDAFTAQMWIRTGLSGKKHEILFATQRARFSLINSRLCFESDCVDQIVSPPLGHLQSNEWVHVGVSWHPNSNILCFFVMGQAFHVVKTFGPVIPRTGGAETSKKLYLMGHPTQNKEDFISLSGSVCDFRLYDVARDAQYTTLPPTCVMNWQDVTESRDLVMCYPLVRTAFDSSFLTNALQKNQPLTLHGNLRDAEALVPIRGYETLVKSLVNAERVAIAGSTLVHPQTKRLCVPSGVSASPESGFVWLRDATRNVAQGFTARVAISSSRFSRVTFRVKSGSWISDDEHPSFGWRLPIVSGGQPRNRGNRSQLSNVGLQPNSVLSVSMSRHEDGSDSNDADVVAIESWNRDDKSEAFEGGTSWRLKLPQPAANADWVFVYVYDGRFITVECNGIAMCKHLCKFDEPNAYFGLELVGESGIKFKTELELVSFLCESGDDHVVQPSARKRRFDAAAAVATSSSSSLIAPEVVMKKAPLVPAVETPSKLPLSVSAWVCPGCSMSNSSFLPVCETCGTSRVVAITVACPICTYLNTSNDLVCQICEAPLPGHNPVAVEEELVVKSSYSSAATGISNGSMPNGVASAAPPPPNVMEQWKTFKETFLECSSEFAEQAAVEEENDRLLDTTVGTFRLRSTGAAHVYFTTAGELDGNKYTGVAKFENNHWHLRGKYEHDDFRFELKMDEAGNKVFDARFTSSFANGAWHSGKLVIPYSVSRGLNYVSVAPELVARFPILSSPMECTEMAPFRVGLVNMIHGLMNVCSQNACLQALFSSPSIRRAVLQSREQNIKSEVFFDPLFTALQSLFARMAASQQNAIQTFEFQKVLPQEYQSQEQMDASQFLMDVLGSFQVGLGNAQMDAMFGIEITRELNCFVCDSVKSLSETTTCASLTLPSRFQPITDLRLLVCRSKMNLPYIPDFDDLADDNGATTTWTRIHQNLNGTADIPPFVYLCVKRGGNKRPITEIFVKRPDLSFAAAITTSNQGEFLANGFTPVLAYEAEVSLPLKDANRCELFVKRDETWGHPITDVRLVLDGESVPHGFRVVNVNMNCAATSNRVVLLCYRWDMPVTDVFVGTAKQFSDAKLTEYQFCKTPLGFDENNGAEVLLWYTDRMSFASPVTQVYIVDEDDQAAAKAKDELSTICGSFSVGPGKTKLVLATRTSGCPLTQLEVFATPVPKFHSFSKVISMEKTSSWVLGPGALFPRALPAAFRPPCNRFFETLIQRVRVSPVTGNFGTSKLDGIVYKIEYGNGGDALSPTFLLGRVTERAGGVREDVLHAQWIHDRLAWVSESVSSIQLQAKSRPSKLAPIFDVLKVKPRKFSDVEDEVLEDRVVYGQDGFALSRESRFESDAPLSCVAWVQTDSKPEDRRTGSEWESLDLAQGCGTLYWKRCVKPSDPVVTDIVICDKQRGESLSDFATDAPEGSAWEPAQGNDLIEIAVQVWLPSSAFGYFRNDDSTSLVIKRVTKQEDDVFGMRGSLHFLKTDSPHRIDGVSYEPRNGNDTRKRIFFGKWIGASGNQSIICKARFDENQCVMECGLHGEVNFVRDERVSVGMSLDLDEYWENGECKFSNRKLDNSVQSMCDLETDPRVLCEEANLVLCEHCNNTPRVHLESKKRTKYPEHTVLQMKSRMDFNRVTSKVVKDLRITPLGEAGQLVFENGQVVYELFGVVMHNGSTAQSGHYFTFAREARPSGDGWMYFSDSTVRYVGYHDVVNYVENNHGNDTPYLLFYRKLRGGATVVSSRDDRYDDEMDGTECAWVKDLKRRDYFELENALLPSMTFLRASRAFAAGGGFSG